MDWLGILINTGRKDSFAACERSLQKKRRCKREIVFEPSQEVPAEPKFWGYFAMSPPLMRTHWRLPLQVHARTHAYVHVCQMSRRRAVPLSGCRSAQWEPSVGGGDRRSLWKSEHKRAASRGLWKGHKGVTSLWHGALSPGWPSDTDTAASKPLATEREERAETRRSETRRSETRVVEIRMADGGRLPGLRGEGESFLGDGRGQILWHESSSRREQFSLKVQCAKSFSKLGI